MGSHTGSRPRRRTIALATLATLATTVTVAACGPKAVSTASGSPPPGTIVAVGAENEYADVISQVGGRYVSVTAVMNNPNTDPHTYEASPSVAEVVASASLVVQNGLGYDGFIQKIESASPKAARRVVDVQTLLGLPDSAPNPHLWYRPTTMPAVAQAIAADLAALQPAHAAYFAANEKTFVASLQSWLQALATFKATYPGVPVATTEPVGDALLDAVGARDLTPYGLQADVMNGVDPAPQDVTLQDSLLATRAVKALLYNAQVTDSLTSRFLGAAKKHGIPEVAVYETMPTPGYDYQTWMLAEVHALTQAVAHQISTGRL